MHDVEVAVRDEHVEGAASDLQQLARLGNSEQQRSGGQVVVHARPKRRARVPLISGCVSFSGSDGRAGVFVPYLRCAACFETPSMVPISDHDR